MAKVRIVKFYKQVDCTKSYHTYDKPSLKGAWSVSHESRPIFNFFARNHISGTAKS